MAHAWMVRTFIKHSDEVEDFPELMETARAIFDTARAMEVKRADPAAYVKTLAKKMPRLRASAEQFAREAPLASTHENFRQAVRSLAGCLQAMEDHLQRVGLSPRSGNAPVDAASTTGQENVSPATDAPEDQPDE